LSCPIVSATFLLGTWVNYSVEKVLKSMGYSSSSFIATHMCAIVFNVLSTMASVSTMRGYEWTNTIIGGSFDRIYRPHSFAPVIVNGVFGYFLWDIAVCLLNGYGRDMLIHGVLGIIVFSVPLLTNTMQTYSIFMLTWEASSPFMNARNIMMRLGWYNTRAYKVVEICGYGIFVVVRVLVSIPVFGMLVYDITRAWEVARVQEKLGMCAVVCAITGFYSLNVYWMRSMWRLPHRAEQRSLGLTSSA
jgi:hypothetical protein